MIVAKYPTEARPYAKAAFQFAKDNHVLPQWEQWLNQLSQLIENKDMQRVLSQPQWMAEQKARFVIETWKALGGELSPAQENFIQLLAQNDRFNLLSSICFLYQTYLAEHNQVVTVKIRTAFPIEPDQKGQLEKALEKKYQCHVVVHYEEDKTLLGGVLLRIGDDVMDASIQHRLTQLKSALLEG